MKSDPETSPKPACNQCSSCPNISCKSSAVRLMPIRWTKTRRNVYKAVFKPGDHHFTVDEIFQELGGPDSNTSLASVYNVLSVFAEHGIVRRLPKIGNRTYFDTNLSEHAHVYDLKTGELSDFEPDAADQMTAELTTMTGSFSHVVLFR